MMQKISSMSGFKGWAAAELAVVEDAVEYDASTGAVIGDELEVIAEKANEVVTTVAQPQVRRGDALLACTETLDLPALSSCVSAGGPTAAG
jgi:hypothetical protein